MSFYFIKSNCHNFNGSYCVALSLYIDSTCSYLLKIAKLIFKVACIWDPLGYYCCLNYIIFKFQSPIVNFINLYNIWPEITCTFKKKKNKVKIVKVPSVVEVTTCIAVADGLILLLYSIRHHERTLH